MTALGSKRLYSTKSLCTCYKWGSITHCSFKNNELFGEDKSSPL